MANYGNALNVHTDGIIVKQANTFNPVTVTQHDVLVGAASNGISSIAPSSTSGIPLISQGSSSNPAFGTAVVAGGGTGDTSFTAYSVICGGTTSAGALQNVSGVGSSGQVLTSNGAAALPTWQAAGGGTPSLAPYIVGLAGVNNFTTIQAAINAAHTAGASFSNPLQVYIKPGTYIEDLTLFDGVYLIAFSDVGDPAWLNGGTVVNPTVAIDGSVTANYAALGTQGVNYIKGIWFQLTGTITLHGASTDSLFITFDGCILDNSFSGLPTFTCTNQPQIITKNSFLLGSNDLFVSTDAHGLSIFANACSFQTNLSTPISISSAATILINLQTSFWQPSFNISASSGSIEVVAENTTFSSDNSTDMFKSTNAGFTCEFGFNTCIFTNFSSEKILNLASSAVAYFDSCDLENLSPAANIISPTYTITNCSSSSLTGGVSPVLFFKGRNVGYSASVSTKAQGVVQTTNATATTIASIAVPTNQAIVIEGRVIGQNSAHTDATGGWYLAVAQNNAGTLALVGSATTTVKASSTGSFSVTTSGTNLIVQVSGISATTYNWTTFYDYEFMATNS